MSVRFRQLFAPLLCLAVSTTAQAQEGDYRLEGRDSAGWEYEAAVHVRQSPSGDLVVERTGTYADRSEKDALPFVWSSSQVEKTSTGLLVTFQQEGRGMCRALDTPFAGNGSTPIQARYRIYSSGAIREWISTPTPLGRSDWTWAFGSGAKDYPTLRLVREASFDDLLGNSLDRYEASGVTVADGELVVAFDNSTKVAVVDLALQDAYLEKTAGGGHSNFEALTWDPVRERYYALVEADRRGSKWRGRIWELDDDLDRRRRSWLDGHEVSHAGKGFEGVAYFRHDGEEYLLALLEGNHGRGDAKSRERGHGRIKVFQRGSGGSWSMSVTVRVPEGAKFSDYSGLDIRDGRLALISQESSMLWVGELDPSAWTLSKGQVYRFPRDRSTIRYGSVEGVAWIGADRIAVVSDRPGAGCEAKSESIHVFEIR